jgi:hypothetical protein
MSTRAMDSDNAGVGSGPEPGPVQRTTVPSGHPAYHITVTTEEVKPGAWKAVAILKHATDEAVQATPVPVPDRAFASPQEAEACAIAAAKEWIADNAPRA